MVIRTERPGDETPIARLLYAAFHNHPQHPAGAEPVEHDIVARLRADHALALSLVAETDGDIVGHLALSPARVGPSGPGWLLLGPLGVLPVRQGQGVGSALVRQALGRLADTGAAGVVLVGDPGFYGRFGFAAVPGLGWPGVPERYVLAVSFGLARPMGDIAAHPAFGVSGL